MNSSTSWPWSRKCSATVTPASPTRMRAPGGSFIWPNTSAHFDFTFEFWMMRVGVDFRFDELVVEVVAFPGALSDASEHRIAAVGLGDVVDELLNEHRLPDAGAAEQADLAALGVRREQVDDLDASDENLGFCRLLDIGGGWLMDRAASLHVYRPGFIDGFADHVHDAPERALANRDRDRLAGVGDLLAAHEALRNVHGNTAHRVLAQMLRDFEHKTIAVVNRLERVENRRQIAVELHIDHGADHLGDATGGIRDIRHF